MDGLLQMSGVLHQNTSYTPNKKRITNLNLIQILTVHKKLPKQEIYVKVHAFLLLENILQETVLEALFLFNSHSIDQEPQFTWVNGQQGTDTPMQGWVVSRI